MTSVKSASKKPLLFDLLPMTHLSRPANIHAKSILVPLHLQSFVLRGIPRQVQNEIPRLLGSQISESRNILERILLERQPAEA